MFEGIDTQHEGFCMEDSASITSVKLLEKNV